MTRNETLKNAQDLLNADWDEYSGMTYDEMKDLSTRSALVIDRLSRAHIRLEDKKHALLPPKAKLVPDRIKTD